MGEGLPKKEQQKLQLRLPTGHGGCIIRGRGALLEVRGGNQQKHMLTGVRAEKRANHVLVACMAGIETAQHAANLAHILGVLRSFSGRKASVRLFYTGEISCVVAGHLPSVWRVRRE
jgi:hypothetical protein